MGASESAVIAELVQQGHMYHQLWQTISESSDEATGRCLFAILSVDPHTPQPPAVGNANPAHARLTTEIFPEPEKFRGSIEAFVRTAIQQKRVDVLWTVGDVRSADEKFVHEMLQAVIRTRLIGNVLTPQVLKERWRLFDSALAREEEDLRSAFLEDVAKVSSDLIDELVKEEFDPGEAGLYLVLAEAGGLKRRKFANWCLAALKAMEKDDWVEHLKAEDDVISLLLELVDAAAVDDLGIAYEDALLHNARQVAGGEATVESRIDEWHLLLAPLSPDAADVLKRNILDVATELGGGLQDDFFEAYGPEIQDRDLLLRNPSVIYRLFIPLVDDRKQVGLKWLRETLDASPDLLSVHSDSNGSRTLTRRIDAALGDQADETVAQLLRDIKKHTISGRSASGRSSRGRE